MVWAPSAKNVTAIKFWLDCLQIVTVILAASTAAGTFVYQSKEERRRAIEQDQRAQEQLAAVRRELQRPYQERKLDLYLEAARVLAHLAASPSVDREKTEARFWELYWGQLAFVESRTRDEGKDGAPSPSVETLMVQFCKQYFGSTGCSPAAAGRRDDSPMRERTEAERAAIVGAAITMAHQASDEIRREWETIRR